MKSILLILTSITFSSLTFCQYDPESSSLPELSIAWAKQGTTSNASVAIGPSGPIGVSINQVSLSSGATYDFQSVLNGFRSPTATITITNSSGGDFTIPTSNFLNISGANASDFIVTGSPNGTITNGASTTASIYFNSSSVGLRTATLNVQPGGNIASVNVTLQGTGVSNVGTLSLFSQFESIGFNDSSGNGNNGFVTGNFGGTFVPGIVGNAIRLGYGATPAFDYIDIPDSAAQNFHFAGTQPISVTAWVSPDTSSIGTIFDKSENNGPFSNLIFDVIVSNTLLGVQSWQEGAFSEGFSWNGSIVGWHHVACVYDPTLGNPNTTLYYDGVAVQTGYIFSSTFAPPNSQAANIGRFRRDASQLYVGLIDELRVYYPVALSASQIQIIYNSR
ncbi:LamG-like jellyroll fold domain-containing protein [Leptospira kmetyi]|uniref:LamG-like jellyroll fold domain-containing protein n=1 Tax=Leptospira kmetyi TaxID=408139 RepID=UPI001082BF46|nr:LamG-like jellyroll fold domain-containing protein [Leptospira kmetyi]TGK15873.1 hypothetical protein EHO62_08860 [Leptospira kmetyi]TGK31903.1 hypothetical protein EHO66_05840 [Leptospira kmetyi]